MAAFTAEAAQLRREDALAYLPVSTTTAYLGRQLIFGPGIPSTAIYLVVAGKVGCLGFAPTAARCCSTSSCPTDCSERAPLSPTRGRLSVRQRSENHSHGLAGFRYRRARDAPAGTRGS